MEVRADSNNILNLDTLPYDIQLNILNRLDVNDLNSLSLVNTKLNLISNDNDFWKNRLIRDIHKWNKISSKTYPIHIFIKNQPKSNVTDGESEANEDDKEENCEINYKEAYLKSCPDLLTQQEILKKLETFQLTNMASSSENPTAYTPETNNLTLSTLSMPMSVLGQIKDFIYKKINNLNWSENIGLLKKFGADQFPKLVMFGPGLETTTSCLVTNILWKTDFKTCGMIPGKDGYGSGIKLKLFNHKPFNLTILYTNVSKVRNTNNHDLNANRLLIGKWNENAQAQDYEVQPQVKDACLDASGFIYVIDNEYLANLDMDSVESLKVIENYKLELNTLMKETNSDLPLLILSCNAKNLNNSVSNSIQFTKTKSLSCAQIIEKLELYNLKREWQIINCDVFQYQMKDIVMGFEWILNEIENGYLIKQYDYLNKQPI